MPKFTEEDKKKFNDRRKELLTANNNALKTIAPNMALTDEELAGALADDQFVQMNEKFSTIGFEQQEQKKILEELQKNYDVHLPSCLARCAHLYMDTSGTPEAKAKNEQYIKLLQTPEGCASTVERMYRDLLRVSNEAYTAHDTESLIDLSEKYPIIGMLGFVAKDLSQWKTNGLPVDSAIGELADSYGPAFQDLQGLSAASKYYASEFCGTMPTKGTAPERFHTVSLLSQHMYGDLRDNTASIYPANSAVLMEDALGFEKAAVDFDGGKLLKDYCETNNLTEPFYHYDFFDEKGNLIPVSKAISLMQSPDPKLSFKQIPADKLKHIDDILDGKARTPVIKSTALDDALAAEKHEWNTLAALTTLTENFKTSLQEVTTALGCSIKDSANNLSRVRMIEVMSDGTLYQKPALFGVVSASNEQLSQLTPGTQKYFDYVIKTLPSAYGSLGRGEQNKIRMLAKLGKLFLVNPGKPLSEAKQFYLNDDGNVAVRDLSANSDTAIPGITDSNRQASIIAEARAILDADKQLGSKSLSSTLVNEGNFYKNIDSFKYSAPSASDLQRYFRQDFRYRFAKDAIAHNVSRNGYMAFCNNSEPKATLSEDQLKSIFKKGGNASVVATGSVPADDDSIEFPSDISQKAREALYSASFSAAESTFLPLMSNNTVSSLSKIRYVADVMFSLAPNDKASNTALAEKWEAADNAGRTKLINERLSQLTRLDLTKYPVNMPDDELASFWSQTFADLHPFCEMNNFIKWINTSGYNVDPDLLKNVKAKIDDGMDKYATLYNRMSLIANPYYPMLDSNKLLTDTNLISNLKNTEQPDDPAFSALIESAGLVQTLYAGTIHKMNDIPGEYKDEYTRLHDVVSNADDFYISSSNEFASIKRELSKINSLPDLEHYQSSLTRINEWAATYIAKKQHNIQAGKPLSEIGDKRYKAIMEVYTATCKQLDKCKEDQLSINKEPLPKLLTAEQISRLNAVDPAINISGSLALSDNELAQRRKNQDELSKMKSGMQSVEPFNAISDLGGHNEKLAELINSQINILNSYDYSLLPHDDEISDNSIVSNYRAIKNIAETYGKLGDMIRYAHEHKIDVKADLPDSLSAGVLHACTLYERAKLIESPYYTIVNENNLGDLRNKYSSSVEENLGKVLGNVNPKAVASFKEYLRTIESGIRAQSRSLPAALRSKWGLAHNAPLAYSFADNSREVILNGNLEEALATGREVVICNAMDSRQMTAIRNNNPDITLDVFSDTFVADMNIKLPDTINQLYQSLCDADSMFVRSSKEFRTIKDTFEELTGEQGLLSEESLLTMAETVGKCAGQYISNKKGLSLTPFEQARLNAITQVKEFSDDCLSQARLHYSFLAANRYAENFKERLDNIEDCIGRLTAPDRKFTDALPAFTQKINDLSSMINGGNTINEGNTTDYSREIVELREDNDIDELDKRISNVFDMLNNYVATSGPERAVKAAPLFEDLITYSAMINGKDVNTELQHPSRQILGSLEICRIEKALQDKTMPIQSLSVEELTEMQNNNKAQYENNICDFLYAKVIHDSVSIYAPERNNTLQLTGNPVPQPLQAIFKQPNSADHVRMIKQSIKNSDMFKKYASMPADQLVDTLESDNGINEISSLSRQFARTTLKGDYEKILKSSIEAVRPNSPENTKQLSTVHTEKNISGLVK